MKLPLRIVVTCGVVFGLLVPMTAATFHTVSKQRERLMTDARRSHEHATDVLSIGVSKALWDLAPEGAAPLVRSLLDDVRIVSAAVFDAQGKSFHEERDEKRRAGEILTMSKDVKADDQVIGKVTIEFSLAQAEADIAARLKETITVAAIQAFVCIAILILLINIRVLARLERIKGQAQQLAAKELDAPFAWQPVDEIGQLGQSLETTRQSLRGLFENLEGIVAERTATIKMILDHVRSGFLLVDKSLNVSGGYTKSCEALLGSEGLAGRSLPSLLRAEGGVASTLALGIEQVFEDLLPEDVTLAQLPQRFTVGGRTLSLEGSTVRGSDGAVRLILFTIIDVSLLEQTEKENRANRAMVRILQNLASFKDFVRESRERLATARAGLQSHDDALVRRELHTLKGNASAFGLEDIASLVHTVEDQVQVVEGHLGAIREGFATFLEERRELLRIRFEEERVEETVLVTAQQLGELARLVAATGSAPAAEVVAQWTTSTRRIRVGELLGPLGSYIKGLAEQRGKDVAFTVEGAELLVDGTRCKPILQNLVHLLRNSIDHGIEAPDERGTKSPQATLAVRFSERAGNVSIVIEDDGRGIDVPRVLAKALSVGLIDEARAKSMSRDEAMMLIFADGLSTAESISDTSGRGVGMSAVREATVAAGGQLTMKSVAGAGTTIRIELPAQAASRGARAA